MLSERITALYALLQCNNSDLARYAGCTPSNISRLKSGVREPKSTSRSISAFAEGVYGYADYENMLPVLGELCGAPETTRQSLIPALIAWLYDSGSAAPPSHAVTPKSKRARSLRRKSFGEKLDRAMTLLELSNTQLAALLNIDVSLVSRYRSGIYSPHGNERLSEKLSDILLHRAEKGGQAEALAVLCGIGAAELDANAVAAWLFDTPEENSTALAQQLLRSLDDFTPGEGLPAAAPEVPDIPVASRYVGTDGLRSAVVRFLSDAAREGGELLLYSDEPMDWMSGDRDYFALWASLMVKCVRSGVKIKIIHNVDRGEEEMVSAIKGWFPLYISGMIEPYVFRKERNARFCHTVFLRTGGACIHGFFPAGSADDRWYDYITDAERLELLEREYGAMLAAASPFLKAYAASMSAKFQEDIVGRSGLRDCLLSELPAVTLPEHLLAQMLSRAGLPEEEKASALARYRVLRRQFSESLKQHDVNMILCPPDGETARNRQVNFALGLMELSLDYTQEEYAAHIAAIMELVENEKNFHLTLLPSAPFRDTQIVTHEGAVSVLRCRKPYATFVFLNPTLTRSVSDYFAALIDQYAADRHTTLAALEELLPPLEP